MTSTYDDPTLTYDGASLYDGGTATVVATSSMVPFLVLEDQKSPQPTRRSHRKRDVEIVAAWLLGDSR